MGQRRRAGGDDLVTWPEVAALVGVVVLALVGPFELAVATRGQLFRPVEVVRVQVGRAGGVSVPPPAAPKRVLP